MLLYFVHSDSIYSVSLSRRKRESERGERILTLATNTGSGDQDISQITPPPFSTVLIHAFLPPFLPPFFPQKNLLLLLHLSLFTLSLRYCFLLQSRKRIREKKKAEFHVPPKTRRTQKGGASNLNKNLGKRKGAN